MQDVYIFSSTTGSEPAFFTRKAWLTLPAAMEMAPKSKSTSSALNILLDAGDPAAVSCGPDRAIQRSPPNTRTDAKTPMIVFEFIIFRQQKIPSQGIRAQDAHRSTS